MTIIGLKELRENMDKITDQVNKRGEPIMVVNRSKPYFKIYPANYQEEVNWADVDSWADSYIAKHKPLLESLSEK